MAERIDVLNYDEVREALGSGRCHLLLGNGFSIACDPIFRYDKLFETAKQNGLDDRLVAVFDHLGHCNFEGVMRLLDDADWLACHYRALFPSGRGTDFGDDLEKVKQALVAAITATHLPDASRLPEDRKARCAEFIRPYHNIFTTNYDLLLYWVVLSTEDLERRDGFLADPDDYDAPYVVFQEHTGGHQGILFVHGALHFYNAHGELRKHCWSRTGIPLIDSIAAGLEVGEYPLFVAEGSAEKKLVQISRSGYLTYCLDKLGRIEKSLVVYGLSFGETDEHLARTIVRNPKLDRLYVGLYGDPRLDANVATIRRARVMQQQREDLGTGRGRKPLAVEFFDAATASVWDAL